MLKPDTNLTGNARYEGFCIDLLKDVAHLVGFHYTISIVQDGKYGVEDPETKQWNGIVRELLDGVINILLCIDNDHHNYAMLCLMI